MANIKFAALGGLDENGKNCYILEIENEIFVINYGNKTPISSTNGIDTIIPDFSYLQKNKDRIKGIFISDITDENFSALPWLLMKIKGLTIYSSMISNYIIKDRISKYIIEHNDFKTEIINPKGQKIGKTFVKPIPCASSLPGTLGYQFETSDGNILFFSNIVNGDLKIFGNTRLDFIKENNKNLLALICDSGMANYNGKTIENIRIYDSIAKIFENSNQNERIVVGVYDHELATTYQVLEMAMKYNKSVVAYGKTFYELLEIIKQLNKNIKFPKIINYRKLQNEKNCVVIVSGTIERLYKRFLRITENEDVYLKLKANDKVIMIAPPINGLETQSTFMLDEIARITPHIYDFSSLEHYRYRLAKDDIVEVTKVLKPKYFIPIQGLYRYMVVAQKELIKNEIITQDRSLILKNGKIAEFQNGDLISRSEKIPHIGQIIIDGFGIGDISKEVIFERENIAREGAIICSIFTTKNKDLFSKIDIKFLGIIPKNDRDELKTILKEKVIENYYLNKDLGIKDLQHKLKKVIKKIVFKKHHKEPLVIILISEII